MKYSSKHVRDKLILDHITSSTALLMPVKRLTEVCHRYGVIVLIDGAHTPGQLMVDYPDVDADFYTGNCYMMYVSGLICYKDPHIHEKI